VSLEQLGGGKEGHTGRAEGLEVAVESGSKGDGRNINRGGSNGSVAHITIEEE